MKKIISFVTSPRGREIIRYLFIGGTTTLVNFIVTHIGVTIFSTSFALASAFGVVVSVIYAYLTNKLFVFRSRVNSIGELWHEAVRFFGSRAATMALEMGGVPLLMALSVDEWPAKITLNIIVVIANYIFAKLIVFKGRKDVPS
ncbi:MAG: GtrA family protein [Oscillospiraceae bacterium]|nr:GtrA family protein [Oscillospiraceae bacterium]